MKRRCLTALVRAALVLAGALFALLAAEFALRLSGYKRPPYSRIFPPSRNTDTAFDLIPNSEERFGAVRYRINSRGYRDREYPLEKGKDVFRILVMGSCVAFGHRVDERKTFLRRLDRMLNSRKPGRRFEVINGGVPGFPLFRQVRRLRDSGLDYHPDMIILPWGLMPYKWNEIRDRQPAWVRFLRFQIVARLPGRSHLAWLLYEKAKLFNWRHYWNELMGDRARGGDGWARHLARYYSPASVHWKREKASLEELLDIAHARGIPVLVVIYPWMDRLGEDHPFLYVYKAIAETARAKGAFVVDLFEKFRGIEPQDLWFDYSDRRPNEYAHRILAAGVLEKLEATGLLAGHRTPRR